MGTLIATTQATVDGVIDPVGEWVQADGDHGDYSSRGWRDIGRAGDLFMHGSGEVNLTLGPKPRKARH